MPQDKNSFAATVAQNLYTTTIANDWLRCLADVVPARAVDDMPARAVNNVPARGADGTDGTDLRNAAARRFARVAALDTHRLHAQEHPYDTAALAQSSGMVRLINACRKKDTCLTLGRDIDGNLHASFDTHRRFDQSIVFGKPATETILNILCKKGRVLRV